MRTWIGLGLLVAITGPAMGQESQAVHACVLAAEHFQMSELPAVEMIQDFSDLAPPRVRFSVHLPGALVDTPFQFECEFDAASPPMQLTKFCPIAVCLIGAADDLLPGRLEELNALLDKDGF